MHTGKVLLTYIMEVFMLMINCWNDFKKSEKRHQELLKELKYLVQQWKQQKTEIIDLKNALAING